MSRLTMAQDQIIEDLGQYDSHHINPRIAFGRLNTSQDQIVMNLG
jgi:hypothetical protein